MKKTVLTTKTKVMKDIKRALENVVEKGTPLPGNKCKCGGMVIKTVMGISQGKYIYSNPHCNQCDGVYLFAQNVHIVGYEKFNKMMNEPFTI